MDVTHMTEATQTANTTDARQASMARVTTQADILSRLAPEPTKAPAADAAGDPGKDEGEHKPKKTASERIQELAGKRREAEDKADRLARENEELKARVDSLSTHAKPLEASAKPLRSQFGTDDDYIEALTDWKAKEAIAKREQESAQARAEADQAETARLWNLRQESVMKALPDYADVIGKSEVQVPEHVHFAILDSDQGPQIAYYLALHPEEARRISQLSAIKAIKRIASLERDLADIEVDESTGKDDKGESNPKVKQTKAPPPIEPVRSAASSSSSATTDYETYRERRRAQQRK